MQIVFLNRFYYAPLGKGSGDLIPVDKAKSIVSNNSDVMPAVKMPLRDAAGFVLAEDVYSKIDFPPFDQSNVDGYAIAFKDVKEKLAISGESAAGNTAIFSLQPKHAMRIFTGAPVPANADTVVMQEKVKIEHNELMIDDDALQQGINFRPKGKDIFKDGLALHKDELLTAGAIGFLVALGVTEVSVYKKPSISIIITGNELQHPGKELQYGQVYESNSYMLRAALQQLHFNDVEIFHADDNAERLTSILNNCLDKTDVVLLSGGVSVGNYDFVLAAAVDCGVEKLFHKVKQRPGKPLYLGKKGDKPVFGLPGNPSSVLTCFYEYVAPALSIMTKQSSVIDMVYASLDDDYKKIAGLTFFLKGWIEDGKVTALDAQESYRLSSYAKANCLIRLEEERTEYKKGEVVEVHILP